MTERIRFWLASLAIALVAAAAGFALHQYSKSATDEALAKLTAVSLKDLSGRSRQLAEWKDKVLVINFWATWCEPCREEVPALIRVQSKFAANGLAIVGIAIDSADKVRDFSKEFEINYVVLLGGMESFELLRGLGNNAGGLPFTLVLDRAGKIRRTQLGRISESDLRQAVEPLL
jgi:thiol-disulfide isomerase/thioredoxin